MAPSNRPIRIAGCSGSASDRRHAMAMLAANCAHDPIDVIIGDWMSEGNMTGRAALKAEAMPAYEPTFLKSLEPALLDIAKHKIKVAVNAGASDTQLLHSVVVKMVRSKNLHLSVAWISGDEVLPAILDAKARKESPFENICTGEVLEEWKFEPLYAQAYLGGLGIAAAFARGADIVICGRVSDASPVIGAAYWWHRWQRSDLDFLANAFVAGHLIECSSYVCGGNFTGFKALESKGWEDIGYPIAEISASGAVVITKNKGSGGEVSVHTCTSQLLYEIQGPWYFNSDVTAILDDVHFEQLSVNRVALRGVRSGLPPLTTKVGITAKGGYQAEMHWFLTGLDILPKARMLQSQILTLLAPHRSRFTKLTFTLNGTAAENATDQPAATVDFRVFAQAPCEEDLSPKRFFRPCFDVIMQGYPGATPHLDYRLGMPKAFYEYYVTLLPQAAVEHRLHSGDGRSLKVDPPRETRVWPRQQPSCAVTENGVRLGGFGRTVKGPLGWVVHARSGDKGSDANVGFWVRFRDEWDWLRTLLSVEAVKGLLGEEYNGKDIDRFELPKANAVHFLLHDHLDRGVSSTSSYDFLGKNVAEFLRSRHVDLPIKLLNRGKI